jgi:hypothetical protein
MPESLRKSDRIADHYLIDDRIDDVKGSVARVYLAYDLHKDGRETAFKVLRHEYLALSATNSETQRRERYEAFNREAELLHLLHDDKRVMDLYAVGYLCETSGPNSNRYEMINLALDVKRFREKQAEAIAKGWLPFLALRRYPRSNSLQYLLSKKGREVRLPMIEALDYSLQLVDLIVKLHNMDIIYWDAKPAHAYWDGQQLTLIDWNVSYPLTPENIRRAGGTTSATELKELDMLILGRKIIYPAFIGREFLGNPMTSEGTPDGSRVKEMHAFFYQGEVSLQNFEGKLDHPVKQFLRQVVQSKQFTSAEQLRDTLEHCAIQLGWVFANKETDATQTAYLEGKRKVIAHLRTVHENLEAALHEIRRLEREYPGEDTRYLAKKIRELFKASDVP